MKHKYKITLNKFSVPHQMAQKKPPSSKTTYSPLKKTFSPIFLTQHKFLQNPHITGSSISQFPEFTQSPSVLITLVMSNQYLQNLVRSRLHPSNLGTHMRNAANSHLINFNFYITWKNASKINLNSTNLPKHIYHQSLPLLIFFSSVHL